MTSKKPYVPVVAVLNMKGGVGKTTISANLFRILFEKQKLSTLLIDLDPQFNLTQALRKREDYELLRANAKTLMSVMEPPPNSGLFEITTSAKPPPSSESLRSTLYHFPGENPPITLDLIAGDFSVVKYSLMDDSKKLSKVKERFKSFVSCAKGSYRVIVLDCNPSSSFLTMCALEACTHVLVPVRPDRYSMLGLEILWQFVHEIMPIDPKPEFLILLNGLDKNDEFGTVETELRGHSLFGNRTLANTLRLSALLEAKATRRAGFATDQGLPWTKLLKEELSKLSVEVAQKLGIKP